MTVEYSPFHLDGTVCFNVPYKKHQYSITVKFFPFGGGIVPRPELPKTELKEILTPIARIEMKLLDVEERVTHALWLMSGQALYAIEQLGNCNINMIADFIAKEVGFENQIDVYLLSQQEKSQLSLF
jgi:hypothetical protein